MEFNQETNDQNEQEETESQGMKQWFQDNMRILVSILVVVLIAGGIYSYSNRTQTPEQPEQTEQSDILKDITNNESDQKTATEEQKNTTDTNQQKATQDNKTIAQEGSSQETDNSFIETAASGDSSTKLARRALANYLEKNPDSNLTAEHKIYIEDYLRKNISHSGGVQIGSSVEFSKSLINDAISKSKNLNEKQLQNLHKYAVRVPSLS